MKGIVGLLAGAALIAAVGAPRAFAQSSGSFEYSNAGGLTACVLNNSDGSNNRWHALRSDFLRGHRLHDRRQLSERNTDLPRGHRLHCGRYTVPS